MTAMTILVIAFHFGSYMYSTSIRTSIEKHYFKKTKHKKNQGSAYKKAY